MLDHVPAIVLTILLFYCTPREAALGHPGPCVHSSHSRRARAEVPFAPLGGPLGQFSRFLADPRAIKKSAAPGRGWLGVVRLRSQYQSQNPEDSPPPPSADHPGQRKSEKSGKVETGMLFFVPKFRIFPDFCRSKTNQKFVKNGMPQKHKKSRKYGPIGAPKLPVVIDFP